MAKKGDDRKTRSDKHEAIDKDRMTVLAMVQVGATQKEICRVLGLTQKTLAKHYRPELDNGKKIANAAVASALYVNAVEHNNVQAQIYWMKSRAGADWQERGIVEHKVGNFGFNVIPPEYAGEEKPKDKTDLKLLN